jgi:Flp pilus assembly protein TadG
MAKLIAALRRRDDGAELIEMAIVLPLLLLLFMGLVDFGFMFRRYIVLTNAAAEGARVASLPGYTPADVTARVAAYAANSGVSGAVNTATVTVTVPGGAGGGAWPASQVTVTHVYNFQYVTPMAALFGGTMNGNVTMTSRATMRNQVAAAAP